MARLGHASPRAALIYQHATSERDRLIAQRLTEMAVVAGVASVLPFTPRDEMDHTRRTQREEIWHGSGTKPTTSDRTRRPRRAKQPLTSDVVVARTGVDPVTSRFSGARSTN